MTDQSEPSQPDPHASSGRPRRELTIGWRVAAFSIGCLAAAFLVTVVLIVVRTSDTTQAIRESQKDGRSLTLQNAQVLAIIRSCTTPGEECAARNARTLAAAIDTLSSRNTHTAAVAAAAAADCATRVQGFEEIYRCVVQRLATDTGRRR